MLFTALPPYRLTAQDPTGNWRTLTTAHFNVHVRDEYRDLGVRAAAEAEAAWTELAALLPPPSRKIELVVADNVDDANGYATTYPTPRVVINAMPPAGDLQLGVYDRWLRLVIVHELAHVFHLDRARGIWGLGRALFGRAPLLFPNTFTTPWMREGLAVWYESRITGRGRLDGAFHRAVIRAAVDEQGGLRLDAANTPTPKWPAGIRHYAFGSAVMGRLAERSGDTAIARFVKELATLPFPYLQLGTAWRRAAGEGIAESWARAQADGRMGGSADDSAGVVHPPDRPTAQPLRPTAQPLFAGLRIASSARISPDGRLAAFVHNDGRDLTRLMVLDLRAQPLADGSLAWRRVARVNSPSGIAWMPDGSLLVSQLEALDAYTVRSDLWAVGMNGRARRLTRGMRLREADVAPDGAVVAVRTVPGGNELVLIPTMGGEGGEGGEGGNIAISRIRVIAPSEPGVEYATPRFDPAGQAIVLVRIEGGWHDIVIMNRDGEVLRQVTRDSVADLHPAFTPDGRRLVWSREVDGVPQLFGMDVEGGPGRALNHETYAAWHPAPLAGDSVIYIAYHADGFRLVRAPLQETGSRRALTVPNVAHAPDSVPDAVITGEHAYLAFNTVLPQYWIPQLFLESGGAWFGALTSGTDAIGRHAWGASLMAGLGSLGGQLTADAGYAYAGLRNLTIDLSAAHRPSLYLDAPVPPPSPGPGPGVVTCCVSDDVFHAGVTFSRRRLRHQASLRVGLEFTDERRVARRGVNVTATFAHLAGAPLGISPQEGFRVSASLRHRERVSGGLTNTQLVLRGTAFSSAGSKSFARQVFALRGAYGAQAGDDFANFAVGGVSSGALEVLPGIALGGSNRTFQVRGYDPATLSGRRALGLSLENRVPLLLVDRGLGMVPLGVDRISGALFTDAGMAWNDIYCPGFIDGNIIGRGCSAWIWSVGAELSVDLGIGYDVPLRVRGGAALRLREAEKTGFWIALGSSF